MDLRHAWALGDGAGEDVKIFRNLPAMEEYSKTTHRYVDPQDLTTRKNLYFLTLEGNPPPAQERTDTVSLKNGWPVMNTSPQGGGTLG